jgi:hypothetical protein
MYRTKMNFMRTAIGIAFVVAFAAVSPVAAAETVIPPGNSAATQYTEAFPTSGGEADVNKEIDASNLEPSKVLGKHKTQALENQGSDGKQVAIITAVTGPQPPPAEAPDQTSHPAKHKPARSQGGHEPAQQQASSGGGAGEPPAGASVTVSQPSGSSGLGEILGQATGASSGQLGLLLPLILIGTVFISLTYVWRQRREVG